MLSPYIILQMGSVNDEIGPWGARIIGLLFVGASLSLSYLMYKDDGNKIFPFFLIFIGLAMLFGVIYSFFEKKKN